MASYDPPIHDYTWPQCDYTKPYTAVRCCTQRPAEAVLLHNSTNGHWIASAACNDHISSTLFEGYGAMRLLSSSWTITTVKLNSDYKLVLS